MEASTWVHLLLAVSGSGASPPSAWQDGAQEGRRSWWQAAGQEQTQLWHGHPLAFGHVSHVDGARLVSHGQETASCTG